MASASSLTLPARTARSFIEPPGVNSYCAIVRQRKPRTPKTRLQRSGPALRVRGVRPLVRDSAAWAWTRSKSAIASRSLRSMGARLAHAAALTDAPRHPSRQIEPLTPEQPTTLLATVADHRLDALITVAVGLRWQDVDLEAGGVLSVRQTLERAGSEPRFGEPKTRAAAPHDHDARDRGQGPASASKARARRTAGGRPSVARLRARVHHDDRDRGRPPRRAAPGGRPGRAGERGGDRGRGAAGTPNCGGVAERRKAPRAGNMVLCWIVNH